MIQNAAIVDEVLDAHRGALGADFVPYTNHVYRVLNFCVALSSGETSSDKIALAAVFHDLGIWTAATFDYVPPSIELASGYLERTDRPSWRDEITAMIKEHHKVSTYRAQSQWLVEPFRKADWVDVTRGLLRFGLPRAFIAAAYAMWPAAGFHWRLVQLTLARARRHPLNPLPMLHL